MRRGLGHVFSARPDTLGALTGDSSKPIADYGLLADCNSAALVDRDGSIGWLCLPRFDSPSVFAAILDPDAGHWSIAPTATYRSERRYLPGTLVIETTFTTDTGTVRLTDAMAFAEGQRVHDLGLAAPHLLLRLVEGLVGEVELAVELAPRPEYGLVRPLFRQTEYGGRTFGGPNQVVVGCGEASVVEDSTMSCRFAVDSGEQVGFALQWSPPDGPVPEPFAPEQVAPRIAETVAAWRSWEAVHDVYDGPHRDLVRLSARVLKGLMYRPTGAIVAAPTTSLPETEGGERNWDYRYAWIRDASLTLEALYIGACPEEAEDFVSFMTSSAGGLAGERSLQIMYGIAGEHDLSERRAAAPARVAQFGARARRQRRMDADAARCVRRAARLAAPVPRSSSVTCIPRSSGSSPTSPTPRRGAGARPTPGMWEMRGEPRHHVSSKVLCWVALDRAIALAPRLAMYADVEHWARRARADSQGRADARLERGEAGLRAVVRVRRARRGSAADADHGLPAGHRRAHARDDRGDRRAT